MRLLLHICCAPCVLYPLRVLRERGHGVTGYFYNPNIHPYREYEKRKTTLLDYAPTVGLEILPAGGYDLREFLNRTHPWGEDRCRACVRWRLETAARAAAAGAFAAFSTTLLYSRYQDHEGIRRAGEELGRQCGVPFYYEDWRLGWREGLEESRARGLYRQPYCGCLFSEQERFEPRPGKIKN